MLACLASMSKKKEVQLGLEGPKISKYVQMDHISYVYIYIYPNIDPKNHIQKSGWSNPNSTRKLLQSPACGNQACRGTFVSPKYDQAVEHT